MSRQFCVSPYFSELSTNRLISSKMLCSMLPGRVLPTLDPLYPLLYPHKTVICPNRWQFLRELDHRCPRTQSWRKICRKRWENSVMPRNQWNYNILCVNFRVVVPEIASPWQIVDELPQRNISARNSRAIGRFIHVRVQGDGEVIARLIGAR